MGCSIGGGLCDSDFGRPLLKREAWVLAVALRRPRKMGNKSGSRNNAHNRCPSPFHIFRGCWSEQEDFDVPRLNGCRYHEICRMGTKDHGAEA